MPSGKQSKRRRAVQAPPPVHSAARKRQASPRVLAIAGALLALALAAIVLGVAFSRDDTKDTAGPVDGAVETQQLLKGIPQSGNVLGKSTSPVTIYEYVDAQCPFCEQFETQAMPTLIERYVRTGKAKSRATPDRLHRT